MPFSTPPLLRATSSIWLTPPPVALGCRVTIGGVVEEKEFIKVGRAGEFCFCLRRRLCRIVRGRDIFVLSIVDRRVTVAVWLRLAAQNIRQGDRWLSMKGSSPLWKRGSREYEPCQVVLYGDELVGRDGLVSESIYFDEDFVDERAGEFGSGLGRYG